MQGFCAAMDTVSDAHVWSYSPTRGFFHCTDKDRAVKHGSPMMPFLKQMTLLYPGYNFCGIEHATIDQLFWSVLHEGRHKESLTNQINQIKGKGTFGGLLLMGGIIENKYKNRVDSLEFDIIELVNFVRTQTGAPGLPIVLGRYEKNDRWQKSSKKLMAEINALPPQVRKEIESGVLFRFHHYEETITAKICSMPFLVTNLVLTPYSPIPAEGYCDDHHYNEAGYRLWSTDAAGKLWINHLDSWRR